MGQTFNGPLMVELEAVTAEKLTPETAPPVPESEPHAPTSVQLAGGAMAGQPNWLLRRALGLVSLLVAIVVWDFLALLRFRILGMGVTALLIAFLFVAVAKEALALGRFARLDRLQARAVAALEAQDLDMVQTA